MREGLGGPCDDFEAEVAGGRDCGDGLLLAPAEIVFVMGGWVGLLSGGRLGGASGGTPPEPFSVSLGAGKVARVRAGTLSLMSVSCGRPVKPLVSRAWLNMYSVTGPTTSSSSEICRG